ncbi:MAG: tetratricopeptide repeat protein [Gammaproteobacteria bacterium]|nr:tetratricopeptide repeat protein [Gammaproteobacteria bacterium]MDH5800662.1 tetratricopeptide repeat protein [Gammaproteobacteria bacterium]
MAKVAATDPFKQLDDDELVALARIDMDKGDIEKAIIKIKCVLNRNSEDMEAVGTLGKIYAQIGLFEKSKAYMKQYLDLQPGAVTETFQYGMVHFDSGDKDQALQIWEQLLDSQPTHPPTLFYKGLALAQNNNVADARQTLGILLQSAAADNLYFGKAKELLQALDAGATSTEAGTAAAGMPGDAYKVIN